MLSVCPSVYPSVTLVDCDHMGWKYWKLIAHTISPTSSLFVVKKRSTYSQGNMGKFGETRGWVGKKWRSGEHNRRYLKQVKIEAKLLWTAYRNSPTLFRTVPSPTSLWPPAPSSKLEVCDLATPSYLRNR